VNKRKILTFSIGLPGPSWRFEEAVVKEVCALAGGCTVSRMLGYWMEDAEYPRHRYAGPQSEEFCFRVEIMVELHKVEHVYNTVRCCIQQEARKWEVDTDWVHVTEADCTFRNFSVKEWLTQ